MRASLDVGAEVITTAGLYGTVALVEDDSVLLEVAPGVTNRYAKGAIARVLNAGPGAAETWTGGRPGRARRPAGATTWTRATSTATPAGRPTPTTGCLGGGPDSGDEPGPADGRDAAAVSLTSAPARPARTTRKPEERTPWPPRHS